MPVMVQFGATLERQRNQDWKEFYIDYHVSVRCEIGNTCASRQTTIFLSRR